MAADWPLVRLDDVASEIAMGPFGSDLKTDNFVDAGVPVIRGGNLTRGRFNPEGAVFVTPDKADSLGRANARPGDIVITHRGTLGQVGLIPAAPYPRYVVSQSQMRVAVDESRAHGAYVYYWLKSPRGQHGLLSNSSQTGVPALSRPVTSLKRLELSLPPYAEQRRIAHILGTLDDKIELNRRICETLEEMARALFKSWFVDFDPVRAKAEGRDTGLPPHIADLFPDRLVDSAAGVIPDGWKSASLDEVASVTYGAPFASAGFNAEGRGVPLLRIRDLKREQPGVWTEEVHPRGYQLQRGDIVVGMDGEFRVHQWSGTKAWLNQRLCVFTPRGAASPGWLAQALVGPLWEVERTETATTVIHLGKSDIVRFEFLVPSGHEFPTLAKEFDALAERAIAAKVEARTLSLTRDALLSELIA